MTKLLFITQKVDKDDDVLGAYHHWIEKLAEKLERISVVCLYRGKVELPENVSVYSLGKEKVSSVNHQVSSVKRFFLKFLYIGRFYQYIWRLRRDYDVVFVHMNPEYIFLEGLFWKLLGKKIFLWYNHPQGNFFVRFASLLAKKIFYTSPFAFAARFKNSKIMPAGIDIRQFRKLENEKLGNLEKSKFRILFLGRIGQIKDLETLLKAFKGTESSWPGRQMSSAKLTIVGEPTPERHLEREYYKKMRKLAIDLGINQDINWQNSVPNYQTPVIYNQHDLFVNLTLTGSFDKTILEAMACGTLTLVSNRSFEGILPKEFIFKEKDTNDLAQKIINIIDMSFQEKEKYRKQLRQYAVENHSLDKLAKELSEIIQIN